MKLAGFFFGGGGRKINKRNHTRYNYLLSVTVLWGIETYKSFFFGNFLEEQTFNIFPRYTQIFLEALLLLNLQSC